MARPLIFGLIAAFALAATAPAFAGGHDQGDAPRYEQDRGYDGGDDRGYGDERGGPERGPPSQGGCDTRYPTDARGGPSPCCCAGQEVHLTDGGYYGGGVGPVIEYYGGGGGGGGAFAFAGASASASASASARVSVSVRFRGGGGGHHGHHGGGCGCH